MTLRRPAAYLQRPSSWRRSGDESHWESFKSEGEPYVSRPPRATRPRSAIEGGQLDRWMEHLQRMQQDLLRSPVHDEVPAFNDRMRYMPAPDKEPRSWTQQGNLSYSRDSSSCGSPTPCQSFLGSQDSLQSGLFSPLERKGSWERAHITSAPRKEQAHLSYLTPVKTGWLPVQRRVMRVADQNQTCSDHSAGLVKLKQAITPTFQKSRAAAAAASRHHDGEVERSHAGASALGLRTWQTPDQGSPIIKQVPEKQSHTANEVDRPVGWQGLRRGWTTNRYQPTPPAGSQSSELPSGIGSDPYKKTTSVDPHKYTSVHQAPSAEPCRPHTLQQGINRTPSFKSHTPLLRASSGQPLKPTAPPCSTHSGLQPSHIHTSSAVTTLVPQNKVGFSSITISSRRVSRSVSLSGFDSRHRNHSGNTMPLAHESADPNSREVTVQRKATIVKVTEQRTMPSPASSTEVAGTAPTGHAVDTVVHRRKATIIKVTEHRESYSPARTCAGRRNPEFRHSYTEGAYKENSMWSQGKHSGPLYRVLDSTEKPHSTADNTSTLDPGRNDGALHTSTLSLFFSNPPAIAAPTPVELRQKPVGQRSNRPLSCYGNVFGHTEPREEHVPPPRKWSFGLQQEEVNPVNSCGRLIRPGTSVNEAGQLMADTFKPNIGETDIFPPPEDTRRRSSPSLTLITAPDPHSHQSPEDVLALNAAAIIANIKLQRQLSKKKTTNGNSEKDTTTSPQGNTDDESCMKRQVQRHDKPDASFVPLSHDPEPSGKTVSLQEALQRSRPHFIARSQDRVQKLERRAQERREEEQARHPQSNAALRQGRAHSARSTPMNDNLFKPRDAANAGKEMQLRSKRTLADMRRKKEEEKKREVSLSNRQRLELFKKKLLDQILQRGNS